MPDFKRRRASLRPTTNPYLIKLYAPFKRALPIPTSDVFDEPTVQICVNEDWSSIILGALEPLRWDDLWQGATLESKQHVLGQVQALMFALMGNGSCPMIEEIRVNECALQVRYRGGATWVTVGDLTSCAVPGEKGDKGDPGEPGADGLPGVPGTDGQDGASVELRKTSSAIQWRQDDDDPTWADLVALADLKGAKGDTGATGATGPQGEQGPQGPKGDKGDPGDSGVDNPGDPPGGSNGQRCGVAIGLTGWIRDIHESHMNYLEAGVSAANAAIDVIDGFGGLKISGILSIGVTALSIGLTVIRGENNVDFWEAVQCKLYCMLPQSGAIDETIIANWGDSLVGLNDFGYLVVKELIQNGVSLEEYRRRAYAYSLDPYNQCEEICDECPAEWCYTFDFTQSDGGWSAQGYGTYAGAQGWATTLYSGGSAYTMAVEKSVGAYVTTVEITSSRNGLGGDDVVDFYKRVGGGSYVRVGISSAGTASQVYSFAVNDTVSHLALNPNGAGNVTAYVTRVTLRGTGANPFGEDNCT